jgi:hypothetical protein
MQTSPSANAASSIRGLWHPGAMRAPPGALPSWLHSPSKSSTELSEEHAAAARASRVNPRGL